MGKSTAAYIVNDSKLLLLLRDNLPQIEDSNTWDVPGGSCMRGESYEKCLIREVAEELELGLSEERLTFLGESTTPKGNVEHAFLIQVTDREKKSLVLHEGQKMNFFNLDEVDNLRLTRQLRKVFPVFQQKITQKTL